VIASALRLACALCLAALGLTWRRPWTVELRPVLLFGVPALALTVLVAELRALRRRSRRNALARSLAAATALMAVAALSTSLAGEARFRWVRHRVLHAEPDRLARIGRHVVVGYRDLGELTELLERRAVGGVFLSSRNAAGRTTADIAEEVAGFQALRRRTGEPPLWIAADQEGGLVSRLSPPLETLPPLSWAATACAAADGCREAVAGLARTQAHGLASLGVNLDLAPVVDVDHEVVNPADRFTLVHQRAIGADPVMVRRVAETYCSALAESGVACTLKHFPGLGWVFDDTHRRPGILLAPMAELAASDWLPFRAALGHDERFTMIAHARLAALDPERPASISRAVVGGLLRGTWGHDGPLITDDFGMTAMVQSRSGVGRGAVEALDAGVDLILVSYDPDLVYPVLDALLQADRAGALDGTALRRSELRLARAWRALGR
jgi:beta-N-acetylhexosaminidase